jgi:hypothetical protein
VRALVLVLCLTACTPNLALERDLGIYGVWAKRGQIVGDYAHVYCEQGARREREMFLWALERAAHPATVAISCEQEREGGAAPPNPVGPPRP